MSENHYIGLDVSARTVNLCVVDPQRRSLAITHVALPPKITAPGVAVAADIPKAAR
jgi:hypothetical protein